MFLFSVLGDFFYKQILQWTDFLQNCAERTFRSTSTLLVWLMAHCITNLQFYLNPSVNCMFGMFPLINRCF